MSAAKKQPPLVFDSFALLCLLHKEPGWQKVKALLSDLAAHGQTGIMCGINWGELSYILSRRVGAAQAREALILVGQLPITVAGVDLELIKAAADIKAAHPVSYADAFCVATALRHHGRIVTADPEYQAVAKVVAIEWLRPKG